MIRKLAIAALRRLATKIDAGEPEAPKPADLEPLERSAPPQWPDSAQPLTPAQRDNLEALRNRYAPDRQRRG